jgi:hypothetical protein
MQSRENITFTVDEHEDGLRLDRACASRHPGLSRNQIQIVNGLGGITVDGVSRPDSYQLSAGERVEIRAGDRLILYGRTPRIAELDQRRPGTEGEQSHRTAIEEQARIEEQERRRAGRSSDPSKDPA